MAESYKVLKIDERVRLGDANRVETYYRHQIKTKAGVVLTVDIERQNFTPEKAAPILEKRALEADKIMAL